MAELIVVRYKGIGQARQVLHRLQGLEEDWVIELQDALTVYRDSNGTLRLEETTYPTEAEGAGVGGFLGGLVGLLIAIPLTGGATAVPAAALAAGALGGGALGAATGVISTDLWREDTGLSEEFVTSVSAMLEPGDSAIFALIRSGNPQRVADQFRNTGGRILRTTLTPEQRQRLQEILDGRGTTFELEAPKAESRSRSTTAW